MPQYVNVNNVVRPVTKRYSVLNNVVRQVQKAYANVDGVARQYFGTGYKVVFATLGTNNTSRTLHESFAGPTSGGWRFYLDSTGTVTSTSNPHRAVVTITGDIGGKEVKMTAKTVANDIYESFTHYDIAKATWWKSGGDPTTSQTFMSDTEETKIWTLPDDVDTLRIGVWLGSEGRAQIEMIVSELEISGEKII